MAEENNAKEATGPKLIAPGQAPEVTPTAPTRAEEDILSTPLPSPPRLPIIDAEPEALPIPKKDSSAPAAAPEKPSPEQEKELRKLRDEASRLVRAELYIEAARKVSDIVRANTDDLNAMRAKKKPIVDDTENPYIDVTDSKKAVANSIRKYDDIVTEAGGDNTRSSEEINVINGMEKDELQKWIAEKKEALSPLLKEKGLSPAIMNEDVTMKTKNGGILKIEKTDAAYELLIRQEVLELALENEYTQEDKGVLQKKLSATNDFIARIAPPAKGKFSGKDLPPYIVSASAAGAFVHPVYAEGSFSRITGRPVPDAVEEPTPSHDPNAIPRSRYKDGEDMLYKKKPPADEEAPSPVKDLRHIKPNTSTKSPQDAKIDAGKGYGMLPEALRDSVAQFMQERNTPLESEHNTKISAKPIAKGGPVVS